MSNDPGGAFITIEGGEGVGKSTSLAAVEQAIRALGVDVIVTREPGGTPLGEEIRTLILDGQHESLTANTEVLLMFAARAQHVADVIRPALEAGRWVLCDRFTDATVAYQGGGRMVSRLLLDHLQADVLGHLRPDLTLLLDAPVEIGFERIRSRPLDHFERAGLVFLERVRQAYLRIAAEDPGRVKVVDATRAADLVAKEMTAHVRAFANGFSGTSNGGSCQI